MAGRRKHFLAAPPPAPPSPVLRTLKYASATEHFVRRLGSALVLQWDALPDSLQDLIIDQAAIVEDSSDDAHGPRDIEDFIRKAQSVALRPASLVVADEASAK